MSYAEDMEIAIRNSELGIGDLLPIFAFLYHSNIKLAG